MPGSSRRHYSTIQLFNEVAVTFVFPARSDGTPYIAQTDTLLSARLEVFQKSYPLGSTCDDFQCQQGLGFTLVCLAGCCGTPPTDTTPPRGCDLLDVCMYLVFKQRTVHRDAVSTLTEEEESAPTERSS